MNIVRDIQSLSIFKRDASKIIKQIKATKEPVVLTVNGKAEVVVQDAESYQNLIDAKKRAETVAVLRERLKSLDDGAKAVPMDEVFQELAIEGYRSGILSLGEVAEILNLSINDADGFLKERGIPSLTTGADIKADTDALLALLS